MKRLNKEHQPLKYWRNVRRMASLQEIQWSFIAFVMLFMMILSPLTAFARSGSGPNWTSYQNNISRSGDNKAEKIISPTSAPNLKLHWTHTAAGSIFTQPVVANKLVYWGSWDNGTEHATDFNNNRVWTYGTGDTTDNSCSPPTAGVSSTSAIANVTINGTSTSVDFFGGGTATMYALNALTGSLIWKTTLGSSPDHYLWSSPAVYKGNVYMGVASFGDCPLIQGQEVEMNAATGQIENTFNTVPNNCIGASVWGSTTIDAKGNGGQGSLYIVTGNAGNCSSNENYAVAIIELSTSNLSVLGSWQVPSSQQGGDSDFGATPTLFNANGHPMVGVINKNGIFYAFDRDALDNGPVWETQLGSGGSCPQCDAGDISSAAWDGSQLYVGSTAITINGTSCLGGVNALNPSNGNIIWQHCMQDGPVLGAVVTANGVVAAGQGRYLMVLDAASGKKLYSFEDSGVSSDFWGPPSISHGIIYIGNMDGSLYAIGT
jgi:polyvinyl alcohol dehydrogenase (cytochrome)